MNTTLHTQVGGNHYKLAIQPVEYIYKNNLGFIEGNIVKYITRYRNKNGVEDLEKIKQYVDLLIDLEYSGANKAENYTEAKDLQPPFKFKKEDK